MSIHTIQMLTPRNDAARMPDVEDDHYEEHQGTIEDIQIILMIQQHTIGAHHVLSDTEDGAREDEDRGPVEDVEVRCPGHGELF